MLKSSYFVLKPAGVKGHAIASRNAMLAYARTIRRYDPDLAAKVKAEVLKRREEAKGRGLRLKRG